MGTTAALGGEGSLAWFSIRMAAPPRPPTHRPLLLGPAPAPALYPVLFTGRIPESEKVDHYRLADAFVMPGWGEGFGIAYLEAMGCGVPVVASKLDASQEAVRNGDLGIVVNPKEPGEILRGILAALKRDRQVVPRGLERAFQRRT
jgi:glycosyltransferase involved in cell wall biosynthesis